MIRLPHIFSDDMVLQQNKDITLWGICDNTQAIEVTIRESLEDKYKLIFSNIVTAKKPASHIIEDDENVIENLYSWRIDLPAMNAGGPYILEICNDNCKIDYKNMMIGEVWLCGGQSNMELELRDSENGFKVVKEANYNNIRFYNVPKIAYAKSDEELAHMYKENNPRWYKVDSEHCGHMSAIGYYFEKYVSEHLNVTVGIVDCYWGGTSALCWIDRNTILENEDAKKWYEEYTDCVSTKTSRVEDEESERFNASLQVWCEQEELLKIKYPGISIFDINEYIGSPCPWPPPVSRKSYQRPAGLYETMLKCIVPYTIRGVLYYQGEEDWNKSHCYNILNTLVINKWRDAFEDKELPFIITQLPMFIDKGVEDDKNWCILREQQELVARNNDNVGMVCLIDCGEYDNIHPVDKKTPGIRHGKQALGIVYKTIAQYDNMYFDSCKIEKNSIIVCFRNVYASIRIQGECIEGFEIAGADMNFTIAKAYVKDDTVVVYSDTIIEPKYVRYAWVNYGKANVYNSEELPLAPFRNYR